MLHQIKSAPWFGVGVLFFFILFCALGTWQVKRLAWKTHLLQTIEMRMQEKAVPLPEKVDDAAAWEYRRVTMAGRFLHDKAFHVGPRVYEEKNGYHLVVPFLRASGGVVFVNRGWISDDLIKKASRPTGVVFIEGVARLPVHARYVPDNHADTNSWYWIDTGAMAAKADIQAASPLVVYVTKSQPHTYPVGVDVLPDLPNNHMQYAVFWYGMAALVLVMYVFYLRRKAA